MKILILTETLVVGGAETFVIRLANALTEQHDVLVAIMHGEKVEPQLLGQLSPRVRVERLRLRGARWLWRVDRVLRVARIDVSALRRFQKRWLDAILSREQPQVIHSHLFKADRLATESLAGQRSRSRHLITMHGDYAPYLHGQADPFMLDATGWVDRVLRSADAIVAICKDHRRHLTSEYPHVRSKLRLIYNGYASQDIVDEKVNLPESKFLFGMVSRGVEQKGWSLAADAFRRLNRADAALVLVGEGPAIDRLRKERPPGIVFAGFSPRPTTYISKFDVCLLPTVFPHESLPTAVIEYLACGKPVIATDVGEISEMLRSPDAQIAGKLLPFDGKSISVQALSDAMADLMDDTASRAAMSAAAHTAFLKFDMQRCAAAYVDLYREVSGQAPGPP